MTVAKGFTAAGVHSGIKRSRKPDLALVLADRPSSVGAVFTINRVQAAPVVISKQRVRSGMVRAVLLNSGCANCLTGRQGMQDALAVSRATAKALGLSEPQVLLASTGIIGRRLPVPRLVRALPHLVASLSPAHHRHAAQAILTTDLQPKEAAVELRLGGHRIRIGGMAKGSGMIAPSMATMLCVITTDAQIAPALLTRLLRQAAERTFNRISVDADMSTNDCVFVLANGASGVLVTGAAATQAFGAALEAVCDRLARMIVEDGEGVARTMALEVRGGRTDQDAQLAARQVAFSPLVKTMLAGADPNPGRLAAAVGASPAVFDPDRLEIRISGVTVVSRGAALKMSKAVTRTLLARPHVDVMIDLHAGRGRGWMVTGDLTVEYIRINAGYAT